MTTTPSKPPLQDQFPHSSSFPKWGTKSKLNHHLHQHQHHHRFRRLPLHSFPLPPSYPRVAEHGNRSDHAARYSETVSDGASRLESRSSFVNKSQNQRTAPTPEKILGGVNNERGKRGGVRNADEVVVGEEAAAKVEKPWNLRPRRAVRAKEAIEIVVSGGGCVKRGEAENEKEKEEEERKVKSMRLRGVVEGTGTERGKKQRFWIALSREEIEEDVYALTGGRPARRPKKRAKNVQNNLDNLFPGLWLAGVSPECYRALDIPR